MAYTVILRPVFLNAVIERANNNKENTTIAAAITFSVPANGSNSRINEDKNVSNVNKFISLILSPYRQIMTETSLQLLNSTYPICWGSNS